MSVISKNDIVLNPLTQRPIKVGGRVWLKLVRDKVIEGVHMDDNVLSSIEEGEEVDTQINKLDKLLPQNQHAVRGRGKYAGKLVKRHTRPSTKSVKRNTVKIAARAVSENFDNIDPDIDHLEDELEKLIMEELMGEDVGEEEETPKPPKRGRGRPKKAPIEEYKLQLPDEYDYVEESEDEDLY